MPTTSTTTVLSSLVLGCDEVLRVRGAESVQAPRMGFYKKAPGMHDGRPIFENAQGQFLYFWGPFKEWRIGDSFTSPYAGVKSRPNEDAQCPNDATGWVVFGGTSWLDSLPLEIIKASSRPPLSQPLMRKVEVPNGPEQEQPQQQQLRGGSGRAAALFFSSAPIQACVAGLVLTAAAFACARRRRAAAGQEADYRSVGLVTSELYE